jgi:hypothetical protein
MEDSEDDLENVSPGSSPQQQEASRGTLFQYFRKQRDAAEAGTSTDDEDGQHSDEHVQPTPGTSADHPHLAKHIWARELGRRSSSCMASHLRHMHATAYGETQSLRLCRRGPLMLVNPRHTRTGGVVPEYQRLSCAAFDREGHLLLTGDNDGVIAVHETKHVLAGPCRGWSMTDTAVAQDTRTVQPLVSISTNDRAVQSMCWNPANDVEVAVTCQSLAEVQIYDLEYTRVRAFWFDFVSRVDNNVLRKSLHL